MSAEKLREAAERVLQYPIDQGCAGHEQFAQDLKLAADACATLAAHMESASQGFEEWLDDGDNSLSHCPCGSCDMKRAWHAAQAAMQAKLDAAGALLDAAARNVDVKVIESLQRELDAANERVKEITAVKDGADTHVESLEQAQAALCAALATAEHERDLLREEVRRCWEILELYCKELDRLEPLEGINETHWSIEHDYRSPEVRALVECVGPSGATG